MIKLAGLQRTMLVAVAMVLCLGSAMVQGERAPRIVVSGQGSADLVPDMAVLALTVTREAETARAALDANSAAMAKVIKAMQAKGIAQRDLQSSNFSIQPRYTQSPRTAAGERPAPRIAGYTVRNSLTVRVRDIGKVGEVLDESVSLGVNEGGNIRFTNDDPSGAFEQARVKAVQQALAKARTLADAAGVKLGKVLEISEQSFEPHPRPMMRAEMSMARSADAVPIAVGENTYKVSVKMFIAIDS